jgi:hypothetical protein
MRTRAFSPSPLVGEGLGRGGSPSPARGEGSPARPSAGKLEPSYPMTEPCTPHSP